MSVDNWRDIIMKYNHVSEKLTPKMITEFSDLYTHYNKLATCYKCSYKSLKRLSLILNMLSVCLTVVGVTVGSLTLNPIVVGVLTGSGVLIHGYIAKSNLSDRIQQCKFAYTNYEKALIQIRLYLRGAPFNEEVFLSDMKVIDNLIVDSCPPIDNCVKRYDKMYISSNKE